MREKLMNMVREVMEELGLIFTLMPENVIKVVKEDFVLGIKTGETSVELGLFIKEKVKVKYEEEMLRLLNRINMEMMEGYWALDEDREVCYLSSVDFQEDEISREYIGYIIRTALMEFEVFGTGIKAVRLGISSAAEAYREAVCNTKPKMGGE